MHSKIYKPACGRLTISQTASANGMTFEALAHIHSRVPLRRLAHKGAKAWYKEQSRDDIFAAPWVFINA